MATPIVVAERGSVALLRMAHGKVQALDLDLVEALDGALRAHADAPAVVLTGTGGTFSAGVDLRRLLEGGPSYADAFLPALSAMLVRLFAHAGPVVAAVNGHAIAGGCVLAAACDYKIMSATPATIGVPELAVGVPFPVAPLEILRFSLADAHLQELVYAGRTYDPPTALARGLVDEVVDGDVVEGRALEVAERLAAEPRARFRLTKAQLRRPALERIAHDGPVADPAVIAAWKDTVTLDAIRRHLRSLAAGKRRSASPPHDRA